MHAYRIENTRWMSYLVNDLAHDVVLACTHTRTRRVAMAQQAVPLGHHLVVVLVVGQIVVACGTLEAIRHRKSSFWTSRFHVWHRFLTPCLASKSWYTFMDKYYSDSHAVPLGHQHLVALLVEGHIVVACGLWDIRETTTYDFLCLFDAKHLCLLKTMWTDRALKIQCQDIPMPCL